MKDLKEYIDGKVVDGYVSLEDCLSALEQAYNDGVERAIEPDKSYWRGSIDEYLSLVLIAKETLVNDQKHKALFLKYNPKCDYKLTIEKTVDMFWGTEDGWNYCKKKRKGKTLDMVATLRKNLERNRVYVNAKDSYVQSRIAEIDSKMKEEQFR